MARGPGRGLGWCQGRFKGCGYRLTLPRQVILNVLDQTTKHLSAEEIYHQVRKVHSPVGIATVYRTLELLGQLKLVHKFDFGDGRSRYELSKETKKKAHHHHLVCVECQKVVDYTDFIDEEVELLSRTEKRLSRKYNFKILEHVIQFYGLCNQCRGNGIIKGG